MPQESVLTTIPASVNELQPHKFVFVIPQLPFISYFVQAVSMPSVTLNPVLQPNPAVDFYRHGDKMVFEPLLITFKVDEDMTNWIETFNWMQGLSTPYKREDSRGGDYGLQKRKGLYFDAILEVYKNSWNSNFRIKFRNCTPMTLSGFDFTVLQGTKVPTINATLSLQYDFFEIERFNT
jgi:hypothetical protein